ncbi:unnamed protein product [Strongylus vulgaris]|uniref:Uncharacterized protein n=1 Tax=Strongylus vulgaris TaxID=40348 RepID=A0A3P7JHX5_STRVU|nr:unnamed protein product [Strongylus vulgaris]
MKECIYFLPEVIIDTPLSSIYPSYLTVTGDPGAVTLAAPPRIGRRRLNETNECTQYDLHLNDSTNVSLARRRKPSSTRQRITQVIVYYRHSL